MNDFMDSVNVIDSGCWIWSGPTCANGRYGRVLGKSKTMMAHRVSYEMFNGEIPSGMFVCHTCDNGLCVNPSHLFAGSAKDNYDDMVAKGRESSSHMEMARRPGEGNARAKLSNYDVIEMRRMYENGASYEQIRVAFCLKSRGHVGAIITRKQWSHI